jgi:hypothetical protein
VAIPYCIVALQYCSVAIPYCSVALQYYSVATQDCIVKCFSNLLNMTLRPSDEVCWQRRNRAVWDRAIHSKLMFEQTA